MPPTIRKLSNNNNESIKLIRARKYKEEADPIYLKSIEDGIRNNVPPDFTNWLAIKDLIRETFPYED